MTNTWSHEEKTQIHEIITEGNYILNSYFVFFSFSNTSTLKLRILIKSFTYLRSYEFFAGFIKLRDISRRSLYVIILYLKFKMSNHKIVFLSRVVMILPGISLRK